MQKLDDIWVLRHFDHTDAIRSDLHLHRDLVCILKQGTEEWVAPPNQQPLFETAFHCHHMPLQHAYYFGIAGLRDGLKSIRALAYSALYRLDIVKQRMDGVHIDQMVFVADLADATDHQPLSAAHSLFVLWFLNESHPRISLPVLLNHQSNPMTIGIQTDLIPRKSTCECELDVRSNMFQIRF